jgi:Peptidase family M23
MVVRSGNRIAVLAVGMLLSLVLSSPAAGWAWPVDGPVLRPFAAADDPYSGGQHRGIDIGGQAGANLRSPAAGVVSFTGQVPHEGLCVTIRTPDGYSITLVHVGSIGVTTGTAVDEGDVVATIGPSGEAEWNEPYVHLGVRLTADPNGYVDPLSLLPARPVNQPQPRPAEQPAPAASSAAPPAPAAQPVVRARRSAGRTRRATRARVRARPLATAAVSGSQAAASARTRVEADTRARSARTSTPRRRPLATPPPASVGEPVASPVAAAAHADSAERRRPTARTAVARLAVSRAGSRAPRQLLLALLGGLGVVLLGFGVAGRRRRARVPLPPRSARLPLRKMSATEPRPEERLPEPPTTAHPRRRRVALREWPAASGPCGRVRSALRHRRPVSPAAGRRRPHGQRHGRARHAGDGRGRRRRAVAA